MYFKYLLATLCVLFLAGCSTYLGDYKEVYYYKHNEVPKTGSYSVVLNSTADYSNAKYLEPLQKIKDSLNEIGFVEAKDSAKSDYLMYYSYSISDKMHYFSRFNRKKVYTAVLVVKLYDGTKKVDVLDDKGKVSKKNKMLFDSTSVLYTSSYQPNIHVNCLVNAIFKTQIISDTKSVHIKRKISKEETNIKTDDGIYYCLN